MEILYESRLRSSPRRCRIDNTYIKPSGAQWSYAFVHAQFVGLLINRRKLYPTELRQVLRDSLALRQAADYENDWVTVREASRALRWARSFVAAVQEKRGGESE